ncbi:MAG: HPF/RaiA family ribosome-associated protein, partial [Phycisphaerales bacterium]
GDTSVEVIAKAGHSKIFVGTEAGQDAYRCIDMAVHKLERQLRRIKSKERDDKHSGGHPSSPEST